MAFGQTAGPPASPRQVKQLLELLQDAGHSDFRDARGPMGFTQRQAGGKFTRDEADAFIEQLQLEAELGGDAAHEGGDADDDGDAQEASSPTPTRRSATSRPRAAPIPKGAGARAAAPPDL